MGHDEGIDEPPLVFRRSLFEFDVVVAEHNPYLANRTVGHPSFQ